MPAVSIEKVNSKLLNFNTLDKKTELNRVIFGSKKYNRFINEFWTAKQRQANNLHEISYRACYKPQLPKEL